VYRPHTAPRTFKRQGWLWGTMTEGDPEESIEDVRERKMEELKQSAGGDGSEDATGDAPDEPVHVESTGQYRELLDAHDVVLVDFHADWCGPCKMIAPVVEELAAETSAAVAKVDIDAHQGLAQDLGVRGVPTLVVYDDGEVHDRVVGVQEKEALASMIRSAA
jgi:thioredoxin 1